MIFKQKTAETPRGSAGVALFKKYDIAWMFAASVIVAMLPLIFDERFYFYNDMQHQYIPAFYHIGRALHQGEWLALTTSIGFGGSFWLESQYALYNPFSLLLYYFLPYFHSLSLGAAFLACLHYGVMGSGFYFLSRTYGLSRSSATLAAIVVVTGNFTAYWLASVWFPFFAALCWFVWGWAAVRRAACSSGAFALAVIMIYMTISVGFPTYTVVLAFVIILTIVESLFLKKFDFAVSQAIAALTGFLVGALALAPVLAMKVISARDFGLFNHGWLVPDLHDVFSLSYPYFHGFIITMDGADYRPYHNPIFYCAWFIFPLLPFLFVRRNWRGKLSFSLLSGLAILVFVTQGPEALESFRYPIRLLPILHMFAILTFLTLLDVKELKNAPGKVYAWSAFMALLAVLMAWQKVPQQFTWPLSVLFLAVCLMMLGAIRISSRAFTSFLIVSTLFFFVDTRYLYPREEIFRGTWNMLPYQQEHALGRAVPRHYAFYIGGFGDPGDASRLTEFQTGNMTLEYGVATLNGYSAVRQKYLSKSLCMGVFGSGCGDAAKALFAPISTHPSTPFDGDLPEIDAKLADIFRIDTIIVMKDKYKAIAEPFLAGWRQAFDGRLTTRYERDLPNGNLPGTVSYVSPGVELQLASEPRNKKETFTLAHQDHDDLIVFARVWVPGYTATLGGRDLDVVPLKGMAVAVKVPHDIRGGRLVLRWRPPYLRVCLAMVLLGVALGAFWMVYGRRHSRTWIREIRRVLAQRKLVPERNGDAARFLS